MCDRRMVGVVYRLPFFEIESLEEFGFRYQENRDRKIDFSIYQFSDELS